MRLYDDVSVGGFLVPPSGPALDIIADPATVMGAAVRIDSSNVADFFYTSEKTSYDWEVDFPAVLPPFPTMWMEWSVPRTMLRQDGVVGDIGREMPIIGVLSETVETESGHEITARMFGRSRDSHSVDFAGNRSVWISTTNYETGISGEMLVDSIEFKTAQEYSRDDGFYRWEGFDVGTMYWPFLLSISFLHCKNVTLEDAPLIGPRQQRRALERKGIKQARFKTLVIEPMKQVLKTEGGIERNGLKKALHICRGHFATYSEDKPLFGKYSGTFWKPAHVRGNADNGTVYKDYKVKAPKDM